MADNKATKVTRKRSGPKPLEEALRDKAGELHHLAGRAMVDGKRDLANKISDHASATEKLAREAANANPPPDDEPARG